MGYVLRKCEYPDDKRYWDGRPLLTYMGDCPIVISVSIRNIGKTYAVFKNLREQLDKGYNVAVSRYDRVELGTTITDFLRYYEGVDEEGNVTKGYTEIRPPIQETPLRIYRFPNGACAYFFTIKDSPNLKGLEIPNLTRWYIDEFIPISYKVQTRKYKEFALFTELYHTVLRSNENLKVIMTANCKTWDNPYFMGWEIPKFDSGHIMKITSGGLRLAIENVGPSKAMAAAFVSAEERMGKSRDEIEWELKNYASDPDGFIASCANATDTGFRIRFRGRSYRLSYKRGLNYVSACEDKDGDFFLLTAIEPDEKAVFNQNFVNTLWKLIHNNQVRFDSRRTEFDIRLGLWLSKTRVL